MITLLLPIAFLLIISRETLFWAYVLQLKEYRRDKLKEYARSPQGRLNIFNKRYGIRVMVCIGLLIVGGLIQNTSSNDNAVYLGIACLIIIVDGCRSGRSLIRHMTRPDITKRIVLIILTTVFINIAMVGMIVIAMIITYGRFYEGDIGDMMAKMFRWYVLPFYALQAFPRIPLLMAHLIVLPLSIYQKKRILGQAKAYIASQGRTTIGISGSYAKSSVKMFLNAILRSQYPVLTTPGNVNTEIGISQFVLTQGDSEIAKQGENLNNSKVKIQNSRSPFFICEMGTYAIGETKIIGDIVNHQYGFLTGLNNQHVDLFGSLANAITAESEILINLRRVGGTIYANRDDHLVRSVSFVGVTLVKYSITNPTADIYISDITGQPGEYTFTFHDTRVANQQQGSTIFHTNVIGKHNILNLAGVIACALDQGISRENIQTIIKTIGNHQKTLHISSILKLQNTKTLKFQLIDDTYNINQNGVKAGLDLLSEYPTKRIVVIDEIIELGTESRETHLQIGQTLSLYDLDLIILTGKNYGHRIAEGYTGHTPVIQSVLDGQQSCVDAIHKYENNTTILFLGRGCKNLLQSFYE